ncbi:Penicillin-binding protein 1A [Escherichia coli]|uniref:Penicillin-binding protein 1A n=1 Tax=Escherichia coli TaxID=562 RepID=A0A484Y887_ECOLX|nr:Penicillin-binding protein 1A [Escherichia coli]
MPSLAWDAYMKAVLEGVPEQPLTPPPGIVTVNIDRSTGQLANGGNSREEYFHRRYAADTTGGARGGNDHYR